MPQILVVSENPDETVSEVVYRERLTLRDFESAHFSSQLAERVGWAVLDANRLERHAELTEPRPELSVVRPTVSA